MTIRVTGGGLGWCGMSCISSAVVGAIEDAFEFGDDAFDTALSVPSHIRDAINATKHRVFDGWAAWVRLNKGIGRELVNAFNAAYDGVIEIAKYSWDLMQDACALFREYKQYINIGVQVAYGDYANAAANLAEVAQQGLGLPVIVQGTDSEIVQVAEFVCGAVDGITVVAALAKGLPVPPPLPPSSTMTVVDGVAVPRHKFRIDRPEFRVAAHAITGGEQKIATTSAPPTPSRAAPTIIVGASAVAALLLLASR